MQDNFQTDDLDRRILTALASDSRRSYADVASEVGMSTAAVHERVRKMVERGVIERFSIRVVPEALGLHLIEQGHRYGHLHAALGGGQLACQHPQQA